MWVNWSASNSPQPKKHKCSPPALLFAASACLWHDSNPWTAVENEFGSCSICGKFNRKFISLLRVTQEPSLGDARKMSITRLQSKWKAVGGWPALYCSAGRQSMRKNRTFSSPESEESLVFSEFDINSFARTGRQRACDNLLSLLSTADSSNIIDRSSWKWAKNCNSLTRNFVIHECIRSSFRIRLFSYIFKRGRWLRVVILGQRTEVGYIFAG